MSSSTETSESEEKSNTQTDLFSDEIYEHNTENNTPEDIIRDFGLANPSVLTILDIPPAEIIEKTTHEWERLREQSGKESFTYRQTEGMSVDKNICEATLPTELLETVTHHLDTTIDEFKLVIRDEGIYVSAVDSKNVEMVEVWIDKSDITNYTVNKENTVGMRVSTFQNVIKHTKTDALRFNINQDRKITIEDGFTTEQSLIDPDSIRKTPNFPVNLSHTTQATLPGVDFKEITGRADKQTDTLGIATQKPDKLVFGIPGDTRNETLKSKIKTYSSYKDLVEYRKRSISQYNFNIGVEDETVSYYDLSRIKSIFSRRKTNLRDDYTLRLGDNQPIKVSYDIKNNSFVNRIIAPRVKDE